MATRYVKVKKYTGVYYEESKERVWHGKPDKIFWINFKREGKVQWVRCGWQSEGWTPEAALRKRHELVAKERVGEFRSKREIKKESLTLDEFMTQHYFPHNEAYKRQPRDDRSRYETWLKPRFAEKPLSSISPLDVERLKRDVRSAGRSDATCRHVLGLLRHIINMAVGWQLFTGANPVTVVRLPYSDNKRQRFLSVEEANNLLNELYTRSKQVGDMATLALYGGLRLGEIVKLHWGHIDTTNQILYVVDAKNSESRAIRITDPIHKVLKSLLPGEPGDLVFKSKTGGEVKFVSNTFDRAVQKLGLNEGISDRRQRVTFHVLRHSFASWAAIAGTPLLAIGKCLGHKSNVMTLRYSHLSSESQLGVFDTVARFPKLTDEGAESHVK